MSKPGQMILLAPGESYPRPALCVRCNGRGEWWVRVKLFGLQLRYKPEDMQSIDGELLMRCTCRGCDGNGIVSGLA